MNFVLIDVFLKIVSGFFLLFLGMNINNWLVLTEDPSTTFLTLMFFCLNFLAATQDIAVDGWALTMLRKLVPIIFFEK